MNENVHIINCLAIMLVAAIMNFVNDNPIAGWILLGCMVVSVVFALILDKKIKNNEQK